MAKLFSTARTESRRTWWLRQLFNLAPLYKATGAKVAFYASDHYEVHVKLTKNLLTRNYVNTIFGGSMYSSIDPIYMLMLIQILGKQYVVWDKAATIRFVRPARKKLKARFLLTHEIIEDIKAQVSQVGEMDLVLPLEYLDVNDKVCAEFTKTLYIASKDFYDQKRKAKGQSSEYTPIGSK